MRTTHVAEHTPHIPHAMDVMDAMRPWQAFGPPPAPAALDPRRWLGVMLATLAGVAARLARPALGARGRAEGPGAP
jgi:hypothetical protein